MTEIFKIRDLEDDKLFLSIIESPNFDFIKKLFLKNNSNIDDWGKKSLIEEFSALPYQYVDVIENILFNLDSNSIKITSASEYKLAMSLLMRLQELKYYDKPKEEKETTLKEKKIEITPGNVSKETLTKAILGEYKSLKEAQKDTEYISQSEAYLQLLSGKNVFITGPAGSGKSYVIQQYCNMLKALRPNINIVKTSTTGLSASNIGGKTIHSVLGIGLDSNKPHEKIMEELELYQDKKFKQQYKRTLKRLKQIDVLIVDEISMMSEMFFDNLYNRLKDSGNKKIQLIVSGDFSQLPPVAKSDIIKEYGKGVISFCFDSPAWKSFDFSVCYLDKVYRAKDKELNFILESISTGDGLNPKVVDRINKLPRTRNQFKKGSALLLSKNMSVDNINFNEQRKNFNPMLESKTNYDWNGQIKENQAYAKEMNIPEVIKLKEEDTIMITQNCDFSLSSEKPPGYVVHKNLNNANNEELEYLANGTIGIFTLSNDNEWGIIVDKDKDTERTFYFWNPLFVAKEELQQRLDENNKMVYVKTIIAAYAQYPMKLAYAITIHKSQGQTFSNITCDLTDNFMNGMGYVALSRCTSIDGIVLLEDKFGGEPFNEKALLINEESINIKKKTKKQAKKIRKNSSDLNDEILNDPYLYLEERLLKNNGKKAKTKKTKE